MDSHSNRHQPQEYRARGSSRPTAKRTPQKKGPHPYRWLFHAPPITGPGGRAVPFQVPEEYADDLGRHIERAGMFSRDRLIEIASPDGVLNVHELPKPEIRQDPPAAGPVSWLNPGPWVPADAPSPERNIETPDFTNLTEEEADALEAEKQAIDEGLRRRRVWREKLRQSDPEGRAV